MLNGTMMQFFHWYTPADEQLWNELSQKADELASIDIDSVWLPPTYKGASGGNSNGYDVYDLYDIGEFDQKGSVRTKFGTKEEYIAAVKTLVDKGAQVYVDIVLNHKGGADEKELIKVRKVNPENRNEFISEPYDIEAYTKFTFPGRKGIYSDFIWNYICFSGVDYDDRTKETVIFSIFNEYGEGWEEVVDMEKGNYDYLMHADIEFRNEAVRNELKKWGEWYLKEVPFTGVRLDAVKHMSPRFYAALQSLEAPIDAWFKPLAYALILLRQEGYPCLFYPDVYGGHYVDKGHDRQDHEVWLEKYDGIDMLLAARNKYAYGAQREYFDHPNCIGWARERIAAHAHSGCAVLLSNSEDGSKNMEVGKQHAGKVFVDLLGKRSEEVPIDENGWGNFRVGAGSVSVWVEEEGRK